ncbi:MAG: flagellar hook assembly protein FlgD [Nitrospirae bacterium]|nr:flagellar hook assembly protein FlgD [Nitrospirota bacterium]
MSIELPDGIPQFEPDPVVPVKDEQAQNEEQRTQFLTLLLAQLQNQDPLQPMTDTEMTGQLAQFSQLEQLITLNDSFSSVSDLFTSMNTLQAASLLGKTVKATGDTIEVAEGVPETITYDLTQDVHELKLFITSDTGETVREMTISDPEDMTTGTHDIIWDGTDSEGQPVEDGTYTIRFEANLLDGTPAPVQQYMEGTVTSVRLEDGTIILSAGGKDLYLEDVVEIREPS